MGNQVIGDFELVAKIGEGGMGEVFKGRDPMLERDVAIKSLRPEFAARADILERFRTEAVALARLNHPNIAGVYRFFRHADQYYMVMEFVAGETLDQLVVRRGALPWQEAIRYGIAALNGLEHAHRAGVVHRDIKPANMMVAVDGSLKLMDFGIARILEKMRLTRSGHLIGTLEYMSPEQVQGRDVDARSDLYSLAVVLFELLTGRVPFSKGTDFEIMKAQIEEPPPPLRQFAGSLPVVLENILSRALAKDPAQRYPDASAFRNALEGALSSHLPPPDAAPHPVPATRLFAPQDAISTAADIGRSASVHWPIRQCRGAGDRPDCCRCKQGNHGCIARTSALEKVPGHSGPACCAIDARWSGLVEQQQEDSCVTGGSVQWAGAKTSGGGNDCAFVAA